MKFNEESGFMEFGDCDDSSDDEYDDIFLEQQTMR